MKQRRLALGLATVAGLSVLLEPRLALANVGTPLMWAGALHLVFGNALVGLIEGLLLARFWRVKKGWAVLIMIAGNYVAWWSYAFLEPVYRHLIDAVLGDSPLLRVKEAIVVSMLLAFVCSLVLEGPFAYLVSRRPSRGGTSAAVTRKRWLVGHLAAQSATYALLAVWYGLASNASLLRVPVRPELSSALPRGWLYFDDASGKCARRRLKGGAVEACPDLRATEHESTMRVRTLDPNTPWTVSLRGWNTGLIARNVDRRELLVALQTPAINWYSSRATVLPRSLVVYQLGSQIVVLDLEGPAIAHLVDGKNPTVELD